MGDNLKQKMVGALAWTSVDRFGQQIVQLVIGIVMARLLTPNDYGLIGMIMIFIALSSVLIDGGFGQALIRKIDANQTDFSTVFYLNLLVSVFIYIVLFFLSPQISSFFHQPQLTLISRILFLSIIFYAFYFVQYVLVVKELAYKSLAKVNISSTFFSGIIGIILAIKGYGVWALVVQQLSFHLIRLILFFIIRKWRPRLLFSFIVIKDFWSFSINLLGSSALNVIFNNIYLVLIGKFYPLKQVGYFTQANRLSETVNYSFQQILQGGSYPLLVQIQDDEERYRRVYKKMIHTISIFIFPLLFTLIAVSDSFIYILLSSKWMSSVILFQLLCLANIFTPFFGLNTSVLNSRGNSKESLYLELIKKSLILVSIIASFKFGITIMLISFVLANFISYFVSILFIRSNINYKLVQQLKDILPSLGLSLIVTIVIVFFKNIVAIENHYISFFLQLIIAFFIYLMFLIKFEQVLFSNIKNKVLLFLLKKKK